MLSNTEFTLQLNSVKCLPRLSVVAVRFGILCSRPRRLFVLKRGYPRFPVLADIIANYKATGKFGTVRPAQYKKLYPYLKEPDSLALTSVYLHLKAAFENCFSKKRKSKCGFPTFKSRKRCKKSYTTYNQHGTVAIVDGKYIKLPKVGLVPAVIHRLPAPDWELKSATISQEPDGSFYVSVLFEYDNAAPSYVPDVNNAIALDYKSDGLYIDNNGNVGSNHKYFRESQEKLAKEQRKLSRKQNGSNNYYKQLHKVNKTHRHIANQRKDHLHKLSTEIANQYDIVCVESLNMQAMSNKGFGNGKATMDNGYGMFLQFLEYKLADRGKILIKVDKWYPSSQICSTCHSQNHKVKDLKIRRWECPVCHTVHDRDINAAKNILYEGLRLLQTA